MNSIRNKPTLKIISSIKFTLDLNALLNFASKFTFHACMEVVKKEKVDLPTQRLLEQVDDEWMDE